MDVIDPRLGESVLDPACGTGGFLACAIKHVRRQDVQTPGQETQLQASIRGVEKKPLPHLLCATNMIVHGIDVPAGIVHDNTLSRPLRDLTLRDRVDVVLTNPPFGGMEEDGIENNFPVEFRTRETADLFLVLIVELLKPGGRAAVVLPDGTLFGEGVKTRLKERLLTECNLHTIVRLPNGVFAPYTSIRTNVLFFEKGRPTSEVWYYEHPYPEGYKSYSKTKPMRIAVRMDELFITPADVTPLREAVIQLAIRGRLVAQDPEKIDNCCEQHFTEIQERTQSFELPSGWTWSNLKLLGRVCGGGTPSKRNPEFWSGDIPWISPKDMKRDLINQSQDMVTAKAIDSSSIKLVPSGALLMVVRGMILDHSFPVAVTETEVTINQDMKALIPFDSRLSRYLLLLMKGMKVEILKLVKTSTHGTCRLPTHDLFSITLPIPPVEVQQRIISKVDDVMNVLDQLSFRLTAQRSAHNAFATAFLHHLNT